jgi:AraC-like DNA-binding protein
MSPEPEPQTGWESRVSSIRTTDVHLARLVVETYFYTHRLDLLQPSSRLDTHFEVMQLGPLSLGQITYGADVTMRSGGIGAYNVSLLIAGQLSLRHAGRPFLGVAGQAAIIQPVGETVIDRLSADCRLLGLKIDRTALERHLEELLDASVSSPVRFSLSLDVTREPGLAWAGLVRLLADEITNRSGLVYQPIVAERLCEAIITGLLLVTDHPFREALDRPAPAPTPVAVRRAIEAIHAQPEAPFTVRTLAEIAGVSVRSLQEGFRRHVGTTPLAYLRGVRLERAHEDLVRADPRTVTVAEVAQRWGFLHQGRFAAAYRARYDDSPAHSLRRSGTARVLAN